MKWLTRRHAHYQLSVRIPDVVNVQRILVVASDPDRWIEEMARAFDQLPRSPRGFR